MTFIVFEWQLSTLYSAMQIKISLVQAAASNHTYMGATGNESSLSACKYLWKQFQRRMHIFLIISQDLSIFLSIFDDRRRDKRLSV